MFGISLSEIALIAVVALVVVGPQKLPGMLRTLGQWMGKLRRLTTEVRAQTGIDDILREEGIDGGLTELRGILRGDLRAAGRLAYSESRADPYPESVEEDLFREYPPEGADAYGALPDDLVDDDDDDYDDAEDSEGSEEADNGSAEGTDEQPAAAPTAGAYAVPALESSAAADSQQETPAPSPVKRTEPDPS